MVAVGKGATTRLRPGDLIGRSRSATLQINDPRISEVHAYVSLRGGGLVLLALRGALAVDGICAAEVQLEAGVEVVLAPGRVVTIAEIVVPDRVLAMSLDGGQLRPLIGDLLSLRHDGTLVDGFDPTAAVRLWSTADQWYLDAGDGPEVVGASVQRDIDGRAVRFAWVATNHVAASVTQGRSGFPPLRIISRWDSVQLQHAGAEPVLLAGLPARLLSELVAFGGSARWEHLAGELWSGQDPASVRARWDKVLASLRKKLSRGGIRPCLVQTSCGICELVLFPMDHVDVEES